MSFFQELEKFILHYNFQKREENVYEKIYSSGAVLGITIEDNVAYPIYPVEFRHVEKKPIKFNSKNEFNEYLVVFRLIDNLLEKGYMPYDLEIEKKWSLGHSQKSGEADVVIYKRSVSKDKLNDSVLCIIECKTYDTEFNNAKKYLENDGGQLFSYFQQDRSCEWLILYANNLNFENENEQILTIKSTDDNNLIELSKRDPSIKLYKTTTSSAELYKVWAETYNKEYVGNVLFTSNAYEIGIKPLLKKDLQDIPKENKIINQFEEILRHNNISDKENAFNKLISLFICKTVDESYKSPDDEVEFQYKVAIDTYETLQDRLQKLHHEGMNKFMKEEIFYLP